MKIYITTSGSKVLTIGLYPNENTQEVIIKDSELQYYSDNLNWVTYVGGKLYVDTTRKTEDLLWFSKRDRIEQLKQMLKETDWMVTVNMELKDAGLPIKYPSLHTTRQGWRDEINELER